MKNIKSVSWLCALCASFASTVSVSVFAQAPTAYKPGDTIVFTVKFVGADVDKINQIQVNLIDAQVPDDQQGFNNYFNADDTKQVGPDTFEVSGKILPNTASGAYTLRQIAAGSPPIGGEIFSYRDGLPNITIKIDNPARLKKPELKSVEKNP